MKVVNSQRKYPWPDMKVGDSVFFQAEEGELFYNLKPKVCASSHYYGKKTGKKFKMKADRANNGVRIWRIE
jgi:hypothetical protein